MSFEVGRQFRQKKGIAMNTGYFVNFPVGKNRPLVIRREYLLESILSVHRAEIVALLEEEMSREIEKKIRILKAKCSNGTLANLQLFLRANLPQIYHSLI